MRLLFASRGFQLPNGHGLQTSLFLAPMTVEKKPAPQSVHKAAPSGAHLPAVQVAHVVGPVALVFKYVPAGHFPVHDKAFKETLYRPEPHASQFVGFGLVSALLLESQYPLAE
jgi:hypothetical protein